MEHESNGNALRLEPVIWPHDLARNDAIRILGRLNPARPHEAEDQYAVGTAWGVATEAYYDDATDSVPSMHDVLAALGVSAEEYEDATGIVLDPEVVEAWGGGEVVAADIRALNAANGVT